MKFPPMPMFGDDGYSRSQWLSETDPCQLAAECDYWRNLANCLGRTLVRNESATEIVAELITSTQETGE